MLISIKKVSTLFVYTTLLFVVMSPMLLSFSSESTNNVGKSDLLQEEFIPFNIPEQNLAEAILEFSHQTGINVIAAQNLVSQYRSKPLVGDYKVPDAMLQMISGLPLNFTYNAKSNWLKVEHLPELKTEKVQTPKRDETENIISEEVLVMGMQAELARALDIKRDTEGIVEAVTTVDIQNLPNANLAEPIERLAGVSADRNDGEASQLTIRGLSGDYNLITVNGRILPGAAVSGDEAPASRAVDLAKYPAETGRIITVYKSGSASRAAGSIGGTVDITTFSPLALGHRVVKLTAKDHYRPENTNVKKHSPEASLLLNWANEDETFGIGIFSQYLKQEIHSRDVESTLWETKTWQDPASSHYSSPEAAITNPPNEGQLYSVPRNVSYSVRETEKTRKNAHLIMQWEPNELFNARVDYMTGKTHRIESRNSILNWMNWVGYSATEVEFDNEFVRTPVLIEENGGNLRAVHSLIDQKNATQSLGVNLKYQFSDISSIDLDIHRSSASSVPNSENGGHYEVHQRTDIVSSHRLDLRNRIPLFFFDVNDDTWMDEQQLNPNTFTFADYKRAQAKQKTKVTQAQLNQNFSFEQTKIDIGLEYREIIGFTKFSFNINTPIEGEIHIPESYLTQADLANEFQEVRENNAWGAYYRADAVSLYNYLVQEQNLQSHFLDEYSVDRDLTEEILAAYLEASYEKDILGKDVTLTSGLRFENTNSISNGRGRQPDDVIWSSPDILHLNYGGSRYLLKEQDKYQHLLPNLDLKVSLTENLRLRLSWGKSLARPKYDKMSSYKALQPRIRFSELGQAHTSSFSGSAILKPIESKNTDISLEWYFDDSSIIALSAFEKELEGIPVERREEEHLLGLRDPTAGPRAQAAIEAISSQSDFDGDVSLEDIYQELSEGGTVIIASNEDDPLLRYSTQKPFNGGEGKIQGVETSFQTFFGQTGFGIQANYSYVKGSPEFDINADPSSRPFALPDASNSANLIGMYENDQVQVRLAYHWRDNYLSNPEIIWNNPEFTKERYQWDIGIYWQVNDALRFILEGVNLTGEDSLRYLRSEKQLLSLNEESPRYSIGLSYTAF